MELLKRRKLKNPGEVSTDSAERERYIFIDEDKWLPGGVFTNAAVAARCHPFPFSFYWLVGIDGNDDNNNNNNFPPSNAAQTQQ